MSKRTDSVFIIIIITTTVIIIVIIIIIIIIVIINIIPSVIMVRLRIKITTRGLPMRLHRISQIPRLVFSFAIHIAF